VSHDNSLPLLPPLDPLAEAEPVAQALRPAAVQEGSDATAQRGGEDGGYLWVGDATEGSMAVAQLSSLTLDLDSVMQGSLDGGAGDGQVYDGSVSLAVDAGISSGIDAALDFLTSSPDLFDVPAVDVASGGDTSAG
jgi:hypothetical protein